ncbi:predicted protein [Nematostella vectensis]|uniref:Protrudin n=1 Tax=Nematostella vectensis TaxID=45351 RepID=A7SLZ4_NEMVE|nr:predicted protein [Nematostella vectensis]|eukprot:XP_001627372.1 predicted protein [Nematostella vectensis]
MCEKDTRRIDEKADETSDNDSREKTRTVKFDIGEFVHTHRKLKLLCSSWVDLYRRMVLVFSWQSPKTSFVWFIICSYLAYISPVCFLAFPLAYISILLVSSGIQRAGTHNSTLLDKSKLIKKKAEDKLCIYMERYQEIHNFDAKESDTTGDEDDDIFEQEDTNESLQIQSYQFSPETTEYKSVVSRLVDYRQKQKKFNSGNCSSCNVPFKSILKKRQYCRHCGEGFCSRCCSHRVKRAVFGATAPAAYAETVLVCKPCYDYLMGPYSEDKPEEVDSGLIVGELKYLEFLYFYMLRKWGVWDSTLKEHAFHRSLCFIIFYPLKTPSRALERGLLIGTWLGGLILALLFIFSVKRVHETLDSDHYTITCRPVPKTSSERALVICGFFATYLIPDVLLVIMAVAVTRFLLRGQINPPPSQQQQWRFQDAKMFVGIIVLFVVPYTLISVYLILDAIGVVQFHFTVSSMILRVAGALSISNCITLPAVCFFNNRQFCNTLKTLFWRRGDSLKTIGPIGIALVTAGDNQ